MSRDARATSYWYFAPPADGDGERAPRRLHAEEQHVPCPRKEAQKERKDWGRANKRAVGAARAAVERLLAMRKDCAAAQRQSRRARRAALHEESEEEESAEVEAEETEESEEESEGSAA